MRPIKFRVWDYYNEVFMPCYSYGIITSDFKAFAVMIKDWRNYSEGEYLYGNNHDLSQFTGLHDKNGKEIYEGDIVNVTNKGIYNGLRVVVWDSKILCYALVWVECYKDWGGTNTGTTYLKLSIGINCENKGNIYENPELVK